MSEKTVKPIVLMLIEGWGLSANWRGNAIMSAKAENFQNFWHSYYHLALKTESAKQTSERKNPLQNYYMISTGKSIKDQLQFISDNMKERESLARLFVHAANHNSSVHLVGSISHKSQFGDFEILKRLITSAKDNKIFRLYIHLLLDDTYHDKNSFLSRIIELEQFISQQDLGEIVSLAGATSLNQDEYLQNYIRLLRKGSGDRYIDIAQAIHHATDPLDKMRPSTLTESKDALVKNFDTVIFFNHQIESSRSIIDRLASADANSRKKSMNFCEIWTLINFPTIFTDRVNFILPINKDESLAVKAKQKNLKSFFISEADRSADLGFYFDTNDFSRSAYIQSEEGKSYLSQWRHIIKSTDVRIINAVNENEYKLIIGNYSALPKICRYGDFNGIVQGIRELDRSIALIAKEVLERDGIFLIVSPYGLVEKADLGYKRDDDFIPSSDNPVPLIIIANNSQVSSHHQQAINKSLDEIISARKNLTTVHKLLLLLMNDED